MNQEKINKIWKAEWRRDMESDPYLFWSHRLFIEGYPVFRKYFKYGGNNLVLDVGGGTGRYGIKIARDFPYQKVIITDILEESLMVARKMADFWQTKNVDFKQEDATKMTFNDNVFDLVFCDVVIQHIPDYEIAVREMFRVLKPGGRLILSSVNYWNPHSLYRWCLKLLGKKYHYGYEKDFSRRELKKLVENCGNKVVALDGFYFAYGIYRLKRYHPLFGIIGRILNRLVIMLDKFTNRFISRYFGFEIFVVAEKI